MILAVAYTDMDVSDGAYNPTVDVLIAKWVDGGDPGMGAGDRIVMGQYPKDFDFSIAGFGNFTITEHIVTSAYTLYGNECVANVRDGYGGNHSVAFYYSRVYNGDRFSETSGSRQTYVLDYTGVGPVPGFSPDRILITPSTLSAPIDTIWTERPNDLNDDAFIDVELNCLPTP